MKGACIHADKTEPGHCGVVTHEHKGLPVGKRENEGGADAHHPPTGIIDKSCAGVKWHKGAHEDKDGLSGCGLRGASGGQTITMSVVDPLLVPVQDGTMELLAPSMSPKHKTSWRDVNAA